MSLLPRTNNSAGNEIYFALKSEIPAAQTLSQTGNTVSLSDGGGTVNIASTTSVASSAQKTTAITYDTGLLETNVAGVLNVGLGSAIGSTRVEGGSVVISRTDAAPAIEFTSGANTATIDYNATGSVFSESALTTSAHEIGVYTGVVGENIVMGLNQASQVGYIAGQGLPLFVGESGLSSYSSLYLGNGNNPTDFISLDRKDNTDVTQTACSVGLTGAGIINISSQLAGGDIGIATNASADIIINSGKDIIANATTELKLQIGSVTQARLAGAGNIGVGGGGSDGSVFLLKNDDTLYGALNYNGTNDTLNIDNGGSGISVGAGAIGIGLTTTGLTDINLNSGQNILLNSANHLDLISAGAITLTTTNSTSINITTDADLILTGVGIQSATASGASGQYLRIKLNGTFYKILLEND